MISAETSNAQKKAKAAARMQSAASILCGFVPEQPWVGTISQLSTMLTNADSPSPISPPRLAMWLRQHETTLWWDYGVSIRFSRTGRRRLVHVSRAADSAFRHLSGSDSSK